MNNTKTNNLRKMGGVTALLASTLAFANSVEAINLFGNYRSVTNDGSGNLIASNQNQKAVGFTLSALPAGTTGYRLDNIVLRLGGYITPGDSALLQIYADAARNSNSPLGATLQSQVLFNNPISSLNAANNFTFTPTSTFTFAGNTRYWLLVDATAGDYGWSANVGNVTPSSDISGITFNGYQRSINNGAIYEADTNTFNSFNINATAVPFEFEATGGLVMLGGAWLLHKHLQKKKT